jgi:hypothetical protein
MNTLTKFSLLVGMTGVLMTGVASQANAYSFDVITGVDADSNGFDDNFDLIASPNGGADIGDAYIIPTGALPGTYTNAISPTGWISSSLSQTNVQSPLDGLYTYSTIFNLSDIVRLDTVELAGIFSVDNVVRGITLNGVALAVPTQNPPGERGNFQNVFNLVISQGFQSGANTLEFVVENLPNIGGNPGSSPNPTALNVQLTGSAEVIPTPALLPGLLALGAGAIRKRRQSTVVS